MTSQNFLISSSLALLFYMHITSDFHNYPEKTPQISLAFTQQMRILLQQIKPLLQLSYVIQSESVFHFAYFEQSSINSMTTLTKKSKSHTIHFLNITTSHSLKNGSQFSSMTLKNVNGTITSI